MSTFDFDSFMIGLLTVLVIRGFIDLAAILIQTYWSKKK